MLKNNISSDIMNQPRYELPVIGPVLAIVEGFFVGVVFCGVLCVIQSVPITLGKLLGATNITEVDYASAVITGVEIVKQKGFGGVQTQCYDAFNTVTDFIYSDQQDLNMREIGTSHDDHGDL